MTTVDKDSDYDDDDEVPQNGSIGARPKENIPTTDRYGFMGGNQFTREGDIAIPVAVLRKREMKWLDMLDDWDKWMTKKPKKVRERCRKGIPSSLRARAWQRLCGGKKLMEKNKLTFQELDKQKGDPKWVEIIVKDLDRQFPFHEMFREKGGTGQQDLFRLLKAYSLYNPRDGYCQAMAPVAGVLLMHMTAEEAFWCFVQICDRYLTGYYSPGLEAVQVDGEVLHALLKKVLPATYKHMRKHCIDPILYMTEWFMCIFSRTLPWSSVLRVWDMFLFEGIKVLFRVSLVILTYTLGTRDDIRKCPGLYESMQVLKNIPPECLREEYLVEEMLKIHVFEKDLESEHSLTVARRNAMRSRQLSKDSAADMLKSIEALKKKKKKVRPPQSTEADETRSMISLVGYGNESPVKHKKKREKKKTKERDPGVSIYNQTVKPAWSEPELINVEELLDQTLPNSYPDPMANGREKIGQIEYDNGHKNLITSRHNSKSESALNIAANYKLAQAPSDDSNIHEETMDSSLSDSRKGAVKTEEDHWMDTSPSKSSSAIQEDSDTSSAATSEFHDVEDTGLVTFVRPSYEDGGGGGGSGRRKQSVDSSHSLTKEGNLPQFAIQLPGEADRHEEFEAKFEKHILDLSFDGEEAMQQSSSGESEQKFESPTGGMQQIPANDKDTTHDLNDKQADVNEEFGIGNLATGPQTLNDGNASTQNELPPLPGSIEDSIHTGPSVHHVKGQDSNQVTLSGEEEEEILGPSVNARSTPSSVDHSDLDSFPPPPLEMMDDGIQERVEPSEEMSDKAEMEEPRSTHWEGPVLSDNTVNGAEAIADLPLPDSVEDNFQEATLTKGGTESPGEAPRQELARVDDDIDNIRESLEVLPLSETDSSSVSDGRANGGSLNGVSDARRSLTEELDDLDNGDAGNLTPEIVAPPGLQEEFHDTVEDHKRASNGGPKVGENLSLKDKPSVVPPGPAEGDDQRKEVIITPPAVHPRKPTPLPLDGHVTDKKPTAVCSHPAVESRKDVPVSKTMLPRPKTKSEMMSSKRKKYY
ncbi:uncharacterized protein [Apostichopus japonicus]|uniref:uncharacterized protein isoform X2 n=1 Tax=Stichopus japonicus TaxID=307972 RepID=UPI003AB2EBA7